MRLRELSPRDIEHDNPEFRRHEELVHFLEQIYGRAVSLEDTVTVVRFSAILEKPAGMTEAHQGLRRRPELTRATASGASAIWPPKLDPGCTNAPSRPLAQASPGAHESRV